jgi:plasmid stabilization system protein ParE
MIGYRFLSPAEEEMIQAALFYERRSAHLGVDVLDDVDRVVALIRDHPKLGVPIDDEFRRMLLHRFPFTLVYAIESDAILIVAVAHQMRRPGYWRERVR